MGRDKRKRLYDNDDEVENSNQITRKRKYVDESGKENRGKLFSDFFRRFTVGVLCWIIAKIIL